MSTTEELALQDTDQQVAAERNEKKDGDGDARSGPFTPSNQESTMQEPGQQVVAHSKVSLSEESTLPAAALLKEESDEEIHETGRADEEALLSQITDLITVLQESDEVHQLVLRNTGMTDALLKHLMPAIIVSKSEVESINLNLNEIGPEGAERLIQLLKEKPCIQ
ncbi:unnamed protein product, partial [Staurois parvus]